MSFSSLPCGDSALVLQLGDTIDPGINTRVIALAATIEVARDHGKLDGVLDIVPTYRSLLLRYDPERIRGAVLEARLNELALSAPESAAPKRLWRIPCLYGGEIGQDLEELARMKGLTTEELIHLHSETEYRVYMIGFAPGFAYLGGQPAILDTPRLLKPRQNIASGAIGIGGQQGSVNSVAGPSGWRFLGWTPLRTFDPHRTEPCLLRAGDQIRFRPICHEEARELAARTDARETIVTPEELSA